MTRLVCAALCLAGARGCTAIPAGPFEAYADVFAQVRTAGEDVLLDYDVARTDAAAAIEAESDDDARATDDRFAFDVTAVVDEAESLDAVGVRLRAWETLARYNEALAAVAAGEDAQRIADALDGLYRSLSTFPLDAVADLAADVAPFAGAARIAERLVRREIDARRFAAAVRAARPTIDEFLRLLEADAQSFYDLRLGLHDLVVDDLADRIADHARTFVTGTGELEISGPNTDDARGRAVHELAGRINATLVSIPDWPEDGLVLVQQGPGEALRASTVAQLGRLADEIDDLRASIVAADDRLLAYRDAMVQYVRLIRQTRRSVATLTEALERPRSAQAVAGEALELAVSLRRALYAYQNRGR